MRALLVIAGLVSALFAPIIAVAIAITLSVRWRAWEIVVLAVILDALWVPAFSSYAIPLATVASLVLLWGLEPLRREFL